MSMNHSTSAKTNSGPGGIKCPCCNRFGSVKTAKVRTSQINRRKAKLNLKKELSHV